MNLFNVVVCGRYKIPLRCQLLNGTSSLTSACVTSNVDTETFSVFLQLSPTVCLHVLDTSPELYYNVSGMYLENYIISLI